MPLSYDLAPILAPRSIAVIGASEKPGSVGGRAFANLVSGSFAGPAFPVNPKHDEVLGRPCASSVSEVDGRVDLAVIATPAATVPGLLRECGDQGVRGAVVMSAGFSEMGPRGERLMEDALREARAFGMRVLGPNCLGFLNPHKGINATFGNNDASPGSLALVSQSGALCTAILDWAEDHHVGFSSVVSIGAAADVGFGDVLDYLALDPNTQSILLYVEGVRHPRRFLSGLRVAARLKPVVVIKAGRHGAGARAAFSHTGSLVGTDDAFEAALRRAGAVRVLSVEQLFAAAALLATGQTVRGNRLAIVTNAGGPGVLSADRAADLGVEVAELAQDTIARLDEQLPGNWPKRNPVDILGDATPERFGEAVRVCLADENVDGVTVLLTPQAMTQPLDAAKAVLEATRKRKKPVLTSWMGSAAMAEARDLFNRERLPTFLSPEASVEAFAYLARHHANQQLLLQVPPPLSDEQEPAVEGAKLIIEGVLAEGRKTLTTTESRALLAAFHIPVLPAIEATTPNAALVAAETLGLPVAMKIHSPDISHKSEVGGVRLDVDSPRGVRRAFTELVDAARAAMPDADVRGVTVEPMWRRKHGRELGIGVVRDPVFGPVLSFGAGGTAIEVLRDRAVELPPLNDFIARRMIARTRTSKMLGDFRGAPAVDLDAVVRVLLRLSTLVCEIPHVQELDINPLLADAQGATVLDCRISVARPEPHSAPYGHMAIHPYPFALVETWQLADGTDIVLRPIRPEDALIEETFVNGLSEQSKYFRFMRALKEITREMVVRFTQPDYDREMAFIAVVDQGGEEIEIGVARYYTNPDGRTCEFALVVADAWQGKGIGTQLMTRLMNVARDRGLDTIEGDILADNAPMLHLMRKLGFSTRAAPDDPTLMIAARPL
jgi:acetyltransferase